MATTLVYRVHGVAVVSRPKKVMFEGEEIDAVIEGVEIDLVPTDDPTHGSITWRLVGKAAIAARDDFANGMTGTISWAPSDGLVPLSADELSRAEKDEDLEDDGMVTITAHSPVKIKDA